MVESGCGDAVLEAVDMVRVGRWLGPETVSGAGGWVGVGGNRGLSLEVLTENILEQTRDA